MMTVMLKTHSEGERIPALFHHSAPSPTGEGNPIQLFDNLLSVRHSGAERHRIDNITALDDGPLMKKIQHDVELVPCLSKIYNARDYVFLGSCEMSLVSDMGITLDENGRLVLIQGHSHDLIAGLCHKYIKHETHRCYLLSESQQERPFRFDQLYVDENGKLIGRIQGSEHYRSIQIDKSYSYHSPSTTHHKLRVTFDTYAKTAIDQPIFYNKAGKALCLNVSNGLLYAKINKSPTSLLEDPISMVEVNTGLNRKYRLLSIKPVRDVLQLETEHKNKKRIFYLDPRQLQLSNARITAISHKPPQTFFSCLGADIHEKYSSGQPFSSTRLANFSSTHIPLVSPIIDNVRFYIKKAKTSRAKDHKKRGTSDYVKGIDPGIRAIKTTVTHLSHRMTKRNNEDNARIYNRNFSQMAQSATSLMQQLPDTVVTDKSLAGGLLALVQRMGKQDQISLCDESEFSIFFSLLQSGIPFNPGWFAGLMLSIAKTHTLTFSKNDNGTIRLNFANRRRSSCSILAGTGQGLESGRIRHGNVSFLSVMPFEANLILAVCKNQDANFCFDMTNENLQHFINQHRTPLGTAYHQQLKATPLKRLNEYSAALSLDMKMGELRAMVGIAPDANNSLMIPRFSGALAFNSELISLKHRTQQQTAAAETAADNKMSETSIRLITGATGITAGGKVIVSPSLSNDAGKLGLRFSLVEDSQSQKVKTKTLFKTTLNPDAIPHSQQFESIRHVLSGISEKGEVIRSIKQLKNVKLTRTLKRKSNPFQTKFIHLFSRKPHPHPSQQRLRKLLKNHKNKNDILHTLKKIRYHLLNKKRASLNKSLNSFFIAKYHIDKTFQTARVELQETLTALEENRENVSSAELRIRIDQLYRQARQLRNKARYRLHSIEIRSVGELTKTQASILNVIVNFRHSKTLAYTKHLGEIAFEYAQDDDQIPSNITGNYHFL